MKIWTYAEMKAKVLTDADLLDETFVSPNEMAGYFNEALKEAGSEICTLDEDYFLTKYFLPLVTGTATYALPSNIYANKIRDIMYSNGATIYEIKRYRRRNKFEKIAFTDQYGAADYYQYLLTNHVPGQAGLELHPVSRETAILPPSASAFTPVVLWYIRNVARIPMVAVNGALGELCNPELVAPGQVNTGTNVITVYAGTTTIGIPQQGVVGSYPGSIAYVTGDIVQVQAASGGTLPGGLSASTDYFVIVSGAGIKLATSLANALAGTAVTLTTQGTVYFTIQVRATTAIVNATLVDIPEFDTFIMQWVKCRTMGKEDPRLQGELETLVLQKKQMVDTLTNGIPDDDDEVQPDFSHYQEMS